MSELRERSKTESELKEILTGNNLQHIVPFQEFLSPWDQSPSNAHKFETVSKPIKTAKSIKSSHISKNGSIKKTQPLIQNFRIKTQENQNVFPKKNYFQSIRNRKSDKTSIYCDSLTPTPHRKDKAHQRKQNKPKKPFNRVKTIPVVDINEQFVSCHTVLNNQENSVVGLQNGPCERIREASTPAAKLFYSTPSLAIKGEQNHAPSQISIKTNSQTLYRPSTSNPKKYSTPKAQNINLMISKKPLQQSRPKNKNPLYLYQKKLRMGPDVFKYPVGSVLENLKMATLATWEQNYRNDQRLRSKQRGLFRGDNSNKQVMSKTFY